MEKKYFVCEKKVSEEDRSIWFTASTEDRDRDGDVMVLSGWRLDNYLKNPVFLWAHDYTEPPIGKAVAISTDGNLAVKVKFVEKELYPFAEQIFQYYKDGTMSAVSVGFMPYKVEDLTEKDIKQRPELKHGRRISAELLELSAVPVPSNSEALARRDFAEVMAKWLSKEHPQSNVAEEVQNKQERLLALFKNISNEIASLKASIA